MGLTEDVNNLTNTLVDKIDKRAETDSVLRKIVEDQEMTKIRDSLFNYIRRRMGAVFNELYVEGAILHVKQTLKQQDSVLPNSIYYQGSMYGR